MSEYEYDPNSLLENMDGWIITIFKEELLNCENWQKLAILCVNSQGERIFSQKDINFFSWKRNPAATLIDELVKRNVTVGYLCNLLEQAELVQVLKHLKKEVKVKVVTQQIRGLVDVSLGHKIEMEVRASGFPPPTYLWYKGDDPLEEFASPTLIIDQFGLEDEGIYLCLIRQNLKDKEILLWSSPIQLCAQKMSPNFLSHPPNVNLVEGGKVTLSCSVKGSPLPIFSWLKDGEQVVGGMQEANFVIERAQLLDSGVYECIAVNSEGTTKSLSAKVEITSNGKTSHIPEIIRHPILWDEKPERSIGQAFTLFCSARCCHNLTFTWMVNGRPLEGTSTDRYAITNSASDPDYSSSLFYTVDGEDGANIKVVCIVSSLEATRCSTQVKIKVVSKEGPIQYTAGSKWALLIAMDSYNNGPLFTPATDMEKIARELSHLHFHCLLLLNLNLTELKNCVKLFSLLIKAGDYVVFCYAGHGFFNGVDLLMPVSHDNAAMTELETLPSVWVRSLLQKNHPALLFIVLDMCRHIHAPQDERPVYVQKTQTERNCVILNATSEGYQSLENPLKSSILALSLLKHLRDEVDVVTMARSVLRDVAHMSPFIRREQIPSLDINLCDARALTDPVVRVNEVQEKVWSSIVELPQPRLHKFAIDGEDVLVRVSCSLGGQFQLVVNTMQIAVEMECQGPLPAMRVTFGIPLSFEELSKTESKVVYEVKGVHKMKTPLVLTLCLQGAASKDAIHERLQLGIAGIARLQFYREPFEPSLRAKNPNHNIP